MTSPSESASFRTRWASKGHLEMSAQEFNQAESKLVQDHLSDGWIKEEENAEKLIFSTHLQDGRKWTREYDRKTCSFICQRFYPIEQVVKSIDWPNGSFED